MAQEKNRVVTVFLSLNISEERINGMYLYEWMNCPTFITDVCTNRMISKSKLNLTRLAAWKNDLIETANSNA